MTARKVTRSSGNVFKDIGIARSEQHPLKVQVVHVLARHSGLTQTAAAARIGIKQPDLSKVLRGYFAGFSLERLLAAANAMGADFEIAFRKPAGKRAGRAVVREIELT